MINLKKPLKTPVKRTHLNIYFTIGLLYTQATNGSPHKMGVRFIACTADIFEVWASGDALSVHSRLTLAHRTTLEPFMNAFGFVKVRQPRGISADHVYVNSADVDELMPVELWDPQ